MDEKARIETMHDLDYVFKTFKTYYGECQYRKIRMKNVVTYHEQEFNREKYLQAYEKMMQYLSYLQADIAMLTDEEGEDNGN